ncbi:prephenate dehydrogenase [Streptomyces rubrogriseus]|uniref:Prephenate dehydrogenase/arogenate dehydrogenase family protein n=1 Tax=Streptomyces rubrogriseus TaxID=194673 RepID=A0A6G3T7E9_9ACTN|nr:prephenate dehydrogenase [Streptomyces rubrogriseus]NEC32659.1 prephenate dehydrogenase/arogenate dehydrogenase family protein [Streptomyces rubrogriseus]
MRSVVIVGAGVIGRSVGLALRRHGVTTYLTDADPEAALAGERCGAGFAAPPPRQADIAVLAVPPDQVAPVLAEHQKLGTARCYTDVSGVKVRLHREVRAHGCDLTSLVSGAPVVGGSGPVQARADLFDGRPWALTPTEATGNLALNCALELVALCGAVSVLLDPETHDRAVALVSHAPHLVASLVAARLLGGDESAVRLAGQDLRDVTRTADANPERWARILTANAGPVADQLDDWAAEAQAMARELRDAARSGDTDGPVRLRETLRFGVAGRARIREPHTPSP